MAYISCELPSRKRPNSETFDLVSLTAVGDCLYPLTDPNAAKGDLADVVIARERTSHGTWLHTAVRMPARETVCQPRSEVLVRARAMLADR
ncbi:MAG: hypothetical protein ACHQ4F_14130 [Candidatus Dormibacteria bacterium]